MAERKPRPEPIDETESLEQKLERAARDDVDRDLRVSLVVGGGAPSQRYRFNFAANGSGRVSSEFSSELSGRTGKARQRTLTRQEFAEVLRAIVATGVLELSADQPRFLPDTVVGILELSDGRSSYRWKFAADPEQALTQGAAPPPALERAADAIYSLGGRLMGKPKPSIKP